MPLTTVRGIMDIATVNASQFTKAHEDKEDENENDIKSERLFKRIFILLTFVGFSWHPYWGTRNFCSKIFWRMYSLFVLFLILMVTLIAIPCYKKASNTPEVTTILSMHLMAGLIVLLWFYGLTLSRFANKFVATLDDMRMECIYEKNISYKKLYQIMNTVVFCWNALTLLSYSAHITIMLTKDNSGFAEECVSKPLGDNSVLALPIEILQLIATCYVVFILLATLAFYMLVCLILIKEFESCSKTLEELTSESVEESALDTCSRRHAAIVCLTDQVATFQSKYVGIGYTASILIACFTIYNTMSSRMNSFLLIQGIYLPYASLVHLVVFTHFGIKVNTAANSPIDVLHRLEGRRMTDRVIGLVTLFTNKLSQSQIGISVMGLLVISKGTVLALTGTLLTYVFITIQFKPDIACLNQPLLNTSYEL